MNLKPTKPTNPFEGSSRLTTPYKGSIQLSVVPTNYLYSPKPPFFYIFKPGIDVIQTPTLGSFFMSFE